MQNNALEITDPDKFNPFETIGLAFSGGGFRAASFSVGTISYLQQLRWIENGKTHNLLEHVTYMSSASGGTIATSLYALHSTKNDTTQDAHFLPYYKKLLESVNGVALLDKVFVILNNKTYWEQRPQKRRNIINAFALAYDEMLFEHATCSALCSHSQSRSTTTTNLEEVCFNATEFYRGLLFRQTFKLKQDSATDSDHVYGNYIINLDKSSAAQMKLADLLAASSCFPAGFEPIIFPDDFSGGNLKKRTLLDGLHVVPQELNEKELFLLYDRQSVSEAIARVQHSIKPGDNYVSELQKACLSLPVRDSLQFGLMDGGITDNQGFESMLRANERRIEEDKKKGSDFKPFDLMLVNDVGSHYMSPYQLPAETKNGWLTMSRLLMLASLLTLAGIAGLIFVFTNRQPQVLLKILAVVSGIFTAAGTCLVIGILLLRRFIGGKVKNDKGLNLTENFSQEITNMFFDYFSATPLSILGRMVKERAKSVLTLNNDVFLKRIRQLIYRIGFEKDDAKIKLKTNHIYDLALTNDINRLKNTVNKANAPSLPMQLVAESAYHVGTTLWFDSDQRKYFKLADIVACGQFTTCFNLLEYIDRLEQATNYAQINQQHRQRVTLIRKQLAADLEKFKTDPYWMYNELGTAAGIRDFKPAVFKTELPGDFQGLR